MKNGLGLVKLIHFGVRTYVGKLILYIYISRGAVKVCKVFMSNISFTDNCHINFDCWFHIKSLDKYNIDGPVFSFYNSFGDSNKFIAI